MKYYQIFFILVFLNLFIVQNLATTLIVNSLDYKDIISSAVFAKHNDYNFLFALTPNQSIFLVKYYTSNKNEPVIYLEGSAIVLANMEAMLREANLKNLTVIKTQSIPLWVADNLNSNQAIVVGSQYGQDALAVSSYAALEGIPIFFYDPEKEGQVFSELSKRNYTNIIFYGPINSQISPTYLEAIKNKEIIDTGSRYSNNIEIIKKFLEKKKTNQAIFVSGYTFEKSMIDKNFPLILVGKSSVPAYYAEFLKQINISSGVVFAGDADIIDGVQALRSSLKNMDFFIKFGEGYRGSSQPLPLVIMAIPSPKFSIEILDISYNIALKSFELKVKNKGDFVALSASVSIDKIGSGQSSQILLDSSKTTTFSIPLDALAAIEKNKIKSVVLTIMYGEDMKSMDNIDVLTLNDVPVLNYSDNSSVSILGIEYSPKSQEFILTLDGKGFVEGTISFNINNRPVALRVPLTKVSGITKINIKYLLSSEEQAYIDKLEGNYALRLGQKQDVLLKEKIGQAQIQLLKEKSSQSSLDAKSFSTLIFFLVAALIVGFIIFKILNKSKSDHF
jgi:hypothetical protein